MKFFLLSINLKNGDSNKPKISMDQIKKIFRNNKFQNQQLNNIQETISNSEYNINLLILGENSPGKTSIILKSLNNQFSETPTSTSTDDIYCYKYKNSRINILDTSSQSKKKNISLFHFLRKYTEIGSK
jgi:GTPase SAR1 family protein